MILFFSQNHALSSLNLFVVGSLFAKKPVFTLRQAQGMFFSHDTQAWEADSALVWRKAWQFMDCLAFCSATWASIAH